jgi:uncharacterized membrane protein
MFIYLTGYFFLMLKKDVHNVRFKRFYSALLFEGANCIDWINVIYVMSLAKKL